MRLKIPIVDLRTMTGSGMSAIEDEETGEVVGTLSYAPQRGRTVSLFDGKYQGTFATHEEAYAFAKGVAAVLNHVARVEE
jgi:hypothetical protein